MITEDYIGYETAKLLKEKGFESDECIAIYDLGGNNAFIRDSGIFDNGPEDYLEFQWGEEWRRFGYYLAPTLQMAIKWLEEVHHILVVPDYIYEFTDTSWVYKIYRLGENGKPERYAIKGTSYDKDNTPTEHVFGYRNYELSYNDYATRAEALEGGIKYCLENLV